jgi:hypothetical protein
LSWTMILLPQPPEQLELWTCATHHVWLVFETGSCCLFAWAVFEPKSSRLCLPGSDGYRYDPLHPATLAIF